MAPAALPAPPKAEEPLLDEMPDPNERLPNVPELVVVCPQAVAVAKVDVAKVAVTIKLNFHMA